jgi:hypothetical protein
LFTFIFGFVMGLGVPISLAILGWRRIVLHLQGNEEASRAFTDHVLCPLFGRKSE